MTAWTFYRRMPVRLGGGRRLGHTQEIGHAVDYLHVRQGTLLTRDWYIPLSAVRDVSGGEVQLAIERDDLERNRWNVPPEDYLLHQGATPGYEYTSRADIPAYCDTGREGS
jgi:hypothetical protein